MGMSTYGVCDHCMVFAYVGKDFRHVDDNGLEFLNAHAWCGPKGKTGARFVMEEGQPDRGSKFVDVSGYSDHCEMVDYIRDGGE